jgi:LacI family transcriptional regulator
MATIYEVAARAGVSPATVSRVFNGQSVSEPKTLAVRAAAEELNFVPDRTARRLRKGSSEIIALVIPDIENPFYTALARGVEDRAQQSGYSVVLCNTDDDPNKELRYLEIAASESMAGVILSPASDEADLSAIVSLGRPVVAVDRTTPYPVDTVRVDNRAAGVAATDALFAAGYRRVACIAGPVGIESTEERLLGWRRAVTRHRMDDAELYVEHGNFRVDGGRAAMASLLAREPAPDSVVATNNLMAVGALQVLAENGLSPERFGVAVVGDLPFLIDPSAITQVPLPARQLGMTAAEMLLDRIAGDRQPLRTVELRVGLAAQSGSEGHQGLQPISR